MWCPGWLPIPCLLVLLLVLLLILLQYLFNKNRALIPNYKYNYQTQIKNQFKMKNENII